MRNIILLGVFLFFNFSNAEEGVVYGCQSGIGSRTCMSIEDTLDIYKQSCSGLACVTLWENQIDRLDDLIRDLDLANEFMVTVSNEMGQKAYLLSYDICHEEQTFTPEYNSLISRLLIRENRALRRLSAIQKKSTIEKRNYTCTVSIQ